MELEFSPEQEDLRAGVRDVLSRECPMSLVREVVEKGAEPTGLWSRMVELDWPALTVDESHGGLGQDFASLAVVVEEMGRVLAPGPFMATVTHFVPLVHEAGDAGQGERYLSPIAAGERTGAAAVTNPGQVRADRDRDGWVLSGTSRFVLDGADADDVVVAATTDAGVGLFVVPGATCSPTPVRALDATRRFAHLHLDNVGVRPDAVLGRPGPTSETALTRAVDEATVAIAVEMVGACQTILDVTLEYAKSRVQFGVPIGSFQAIKHKFADMLVLLEAARSTAYFAVACIDEDDDRRALAASMAKAAAGDAQRRIAQEGIQILGGIGFTWEHDMHLYVKRLKTDEALFGGATEHRSRVASLIGL